MEEPIPAFKAEIYKIKSAAAVTKKKYTVPGNVIGRNFEINNSIKTPPKNGELYKEFNRKIKLM